MAISFGELGRARDASGVDWTGVALSALVVLLYATSRSRFSSLRDDLV